MMFWNPPIVVVPSRRAGNSSVVVGRHDQLGRSFLVWGFRVEN